MILLWIIEEEFLFELQLVFGKPHGSLLVRNHNHYTMTCSKAHAKCMIPRTTCFFMLHLVAWKVEEKSS